MTMAYLSSPHGQQIQEEAYTEIVNAYEGADPWHEVRPLFDPFRRCSIHRAVTDI
jgi:hypothetical protein